MQLTKTCSPERRLGILPGNMKVGMKLSTIQVRSETGKDEVTAQVRSETGRDEVTAQVRCETGRSVN